MTLFTELPITAVIQERLALAKFVTPTPVQAVTIPPALEGKDVLATAQTGTGKTLAFLIPMMEHLLKHEGRAVAGLILTPTRELAMQIATQFDQIRTRKMQPAALLVGGMSERRQMDALRQGATLVVATPGRLEDFIKRRIINLDKVKALVLDEADRMLDIGFLPAIRRIVATLPKQRQTLCYSATMPEDVAKLARESMQSPVRLSCGSTTKPVETVKLQAFEVVDGEKLNLLEHLIGKETGRCLVFARTKRGTERLAKSLASDGFKVAMIHGNRSQSQRTSALAGFQRGVHQVLVATDVAARGIHVNEVAHVINYDFPETQDDFVHRVGRTGRAGEAGLASTFVNRIQMHDLLRMERTLGIKIERMKPAQISARPNISTLPAPPAAAAAAIHAKPHAARVAAIRVHESRNQRRPQQNRRAATAGR